MSFSLRHIAYYTWAPQVREFIRKFITSTCHGFKSRDGELSQVSKQFSDETRNTIWKFLFSSSWHVSLLYHPSPVTRNWDTMNKFFTFFRIPKVMQSNHSSAINHGSSRHYWLSIRVTITDLEEHNQLSLVMLQPYCRVLAQNLLNSYSQCYDNTNLFITKWMLLLARTKISHWTYRRCSGTGAMHKRYCSLP